MKKKYEFRPDTAIADTAFYAYGKDYAELIENACLATTEAMVKLDYIEGKIEEYITAKADSLDQLLYNTLEEVIYLKDARQLVFNDFKVKDIKMDPPNCRVDLVVQGEMIDRQKHQAHADVKAVTMKDFEIKKIKGGYRASVILDV